MRKIVLGLSVISMYVAQASSATSIYEDQSMWSALYALAGVGILSLVFSSYRLKDATKKHSEALRLKEEMEVKHQMILETMSQNIEVSAKGIRHYKEVLKQNDIKHISEDVFQQELHRFEENETLLLDTTNELIDFLQLKSGNLLIINEPYKLNNILNELNGFLYQYINEYKTELMYEVDPGVATELLGDSKRIEQLLRIFLIDIISGQYNSFVTLKVTSSKEESGLITFKMHNKDKQMIAQEIDALFSNYTIGENYKSKEKLDLYVANELVKQMDGTLDVKSSEEGTTYTIQLPYRSVSHAPLKSTKSAGKRLLILEDDEERSSAVLSVMEKHDMEIDCANSQSLVSHMPNFSNYDMIMVNTKLLFLTIVEKLEQVKKEKPLIVIETYNAYETKYQDKTNRLIDASIQKPLQNEQVFQLLEKIFDDKKETASTEVKKETFAAVEKLDGIGVDDFSKFSHIHLLIAEDNTMNQKILQGVLRNSGMKIVMVNNGQEALDELRQNNEIDLVLMDTNMPFMDGYEATKKIRETYTKNQLPVVAISAVGFENDLTKMQKAGANTFLHKPFQLGELYSAFSMFEKQSRGKIKNISHKLSKYVANTEILDIQKGIKHSNSAVFYKELLGEVLVNLSEIDTSVAKWIKKRNDVKTKEFISHALKLSETIGATSFMKILKEMDQLFVLKEEKKLSEYLPIYTKEWHRLKNEIENYLKS